MVYMPLVGIVKDGLPAAPKAVEAEVVLAAVNVLPGGFPLELTDPLLIVTVAASSGR
jgi:hypothetical protein